VGLHETYLNNLPHRVEKGVITDAVEFLSENWAIALYHDWFMEFIARLRGDLSKRNDIEQIMKELTAMVEKDKEKGPPLSRDDVIRLKSMMAPESKRYIEENVIDFIRAQIIHLPMYYIPNGEFK